MKNDRNVFEYKVGLHRRKVVEEVCSIPEGRSLLEEM